MEGILKVVCTPIGNLEDASPRVVRSLKESQLILAEDTRRCKQLLSALGIEMQAKILVSCHAHNETKRIPVALEHLQVGHPVCVVSDAGAPGVSDPGGKLIAAVVEAGFRVEVIPGPSACIAALMGAGLLTHRYAFLGFLPKKGKERKQLVCTSAQAGLALVIYESPKRVVDTLHDLHQWLGKRKVVVARELTKQFETFHRGVLGEKLEPAFMELGEAVVVVDAAEDLLEEPKDNLKERMQAILADSSLKTKQKAKRLALECGFSSKEAYQLLLNQERN